MKAISVPKNCPVCGRFLKKDDYATSYHLDCTNKANNEPSHFTANIDLIKNKEAVNYFLYNIVEGIDLSVSFKDKTLTIDRCTIIILNQPLPDWDFMNGKQVIKKVKQLMSFV